MMGFLFLLLNAGVTRFVDCCGICFIGITSIDALSCEEFDRGAWGRGVLWLY